VTIQYAVTLPQGGRAASADNIHASAKLAEELGYSHLWANDHIVAAEGQKHPSPFMFDPLMSLATAAAVTTDIGLGCQLTASYYTPLWLANALASLDTLSRGRLLIAIGVGWSTLEFAALQASYEDRGARTDEIIGILRQAWTTDFEPIDTPHYHLPPVRVMPKPAHDIPIWISGYKEPAYRRAVTLGDGYHGEVGVNITPENIAERVTRIRRDRPEESFTFSIYTWHWNPDERTEDDILRERDAYEAAGVQHIVLALTNPDGDSRHRAMDRLAKLFEIAPR
jgi:probable F420-dependent oxidoreductase